MAAAGLVITLAEAKQHLRVTHAAEDEKITGFIRSASEWIGRSAGEPYPQRVVTIDLSEMMRSQLRHLQIDIRRDHIHPAGGAQVPDKMSLGWTSANGARQSVAVNDLATVYRIGPRHHRCELPRSAFESLTPEPHEYRPGYTLSLVAGPDDADVPADWEQTCRQIVGELYTAGAGMARFGPGSPVHHLLRRHGPVAG